MTAATTCPSNINLPLSWSRWTVNPEVKHVFGAVQYIDRQLSSYEIRTECICTCITKLTSVLILEASAATSALMFVFPLC